jgi:hypothetical protein
MQLQPLEFPPKQAKPGKITSRSFIEKNFPDLDLKDQEQTINKLGKLFKSLKSSGQHYEKLAGDETKEDENLAETYESYIDAFEKILPEGYELQTENKVSGSELWRGTDPLKLFSLLSGEKNKLKISSDFPNVAHKWSTSLSYGYGKDSVALPFVLAFGFKRPENLHTKARRTDDRFKDVIETTSGEINFNDVKELAIRLKGKSPGEIFPPKFYKLVKTDKEKLAA